MNVVFVRSSNIFDDSRATKELVALLEAGYSINVLGWNREGSAKEKCEELFSGYSEYISFSFYSGVVGTSKAQKIIERAKWYKWLSSTLASISKIDIIHACDYDTGDAVKRFALRKGIKYVYDIFDYYVDAHPVPGFLRKIIENREIDVINNSTLTIICTEERKEQIKKSTPKRLIVIHNSPDVEKCNTKNEEYDYAYCGTISGGRLITEILDLYHQNSQLKFILAGSGASADKARKLSKKEPNCVYVGAIPYSQVLEIEGRAKVISAIYNPNIRNHRLCAPNKFYEALALGKPIIVCKGTGIDKIVQDNDIGCVIDYNPEEFYLSLKYLLENENIRKQMGIRGRKLYEEKYKWSLMSKRLIAEYSVILNNRE